MTVMPIVAGALGTVSNGLERGLEEYEIGGLVETNWSIHKIGQNTEKSSGDLRLLTVSQTTVENHQLTLALKTRKE